MSQISRSLSIGQSGPGSVSSLGIWLIVCLVMITAAPVAALDLSRALVESLDNGLTVAVLEDHTFPVVSVQMLVKVGARNEEVGRTGLAHYLEHMAFRATESFPDTEVVSAIYAVGGEWHGYTWIDQTTYFETVPKEHLELVLRIEAERLASLLIPQLEVEAERGAVLSELHGYENDPGTVLLDTVVATSFLQHPYRNNTIGWESDVTKIEHRDLVDFYRRHYHPVNAVLAVVGDVSTGEVKEFVRKHFEGLDMGPVTAPLRTAEPQQHGERRVEIEGRGGDRQFVIAYRAPSVRSPDWPAFLVLQEILGGGEGVNFLQNEWGVAVRSGTRLDGIVEGLSTWYPPAYDPYLFVISGSIPTALSMSELEERLEERIESVRRRPPSREELATARNRLQENLIFDIQTTEDAAHQLASFLGYGSLTELLDLSVAVGRVTAEDIQRLATIFLQPKHQTVGRYLSVGRTDAVEAEDLDQVDFDGLKAPAEAGTAVLPRSASQSSTGMGEPVVSRLSGGLPVLFQRVSVSPTAHLRIIVPSMNLDFSENASRHRPVWGWTSLNRELLAADLEVAVEEMRSIVDTAVPRQPVSTDEIRDPDERLEAAFEELLGLAGGSTERRPTAIVLIGDLDLRESLEILERQFGDEKPAAKPAARPLSLRGHELEVRLALPRAQARLGYVVPAPPPGFGDALTWRVLLYILTHGYEGRLGKEAISRRGLVYYIDSSYRSDGRSSWLALGLGVDPSKLAAMRELLIESLAGLEQRPPTEAEIEEARNHLIGRWDSSAQSNEEISAKLLTSWASHGRLPTREQFVAAVRGVSREDVLQAVPGFVAGAIVTVEVPE